MSARAAAASETAEQKVYAYYGRSTRRTLVGVHDWPTAADGVHVLRQAPGVRWAWMEPAA